MANELQLGAGLKLTNPAPVDAYYCKPQVGQAPAQPYASAAEAASYVPAAVRFDGLTVNVAGTGDMCWRLADLSDTGLVRKIVTGLAAITGVFRGPWVVSTAYGIYDSVINPGGVRVYALAALPAGTSYADANWSLNVPVATSTLAGGVKQGANVTIATDGTLSVLPPTAPYNLQVANASTLGGVMSGGNIIISPTGVLSYVDPAISDIHDVHDNKAIVVHADRSRTYYTGLGTQQGLMVNGVSQGPNSDDGAVQAMKAANPGDFVVITTPLTMPFLNIYAPILVLRPGITMVLNGYSINTLQAQDCSGFTSSGDYVILGGGAKFLANGPGSVALYADSSKVVNGRYLDVNVEYRGSGNAVLFYAGMHYHTGSMYIQNNGVYNYQTNIFDLNGTTIYDFVGDITVKGTATAFGSSGSSYQTVRRCYLSLKDTTSSLGFLNDSATIEFAVCVLDMMASPTQGGFKLNSPNAKLILTNVSVLGGALVQGNNTATVVLRGTTTLPQAYDVAYLKSLGTTVIDQRGLGIIGAPYNLPVASPTVLGGVNAGPGLIGNVLINSDNSLSAPVTAYTPGTGITITNNVITATYSLPTASATVLGGVKAGTGLIGNVLINSDSSLTAPGTVYTPGNGINITNNVISATTPVAAVNTTANVAIQITAAGAQSYPLSAGTLGVMDVIVSQLVDINTGVYNVKPISPQFYTDNSGVLAFTAGAGLQAGDVVYYIPYQQPSVYNLPIATDVRLGGVIQGPGTKIDPATGSISAVPSFAAITGNPLDNTNLNALFNTYQPDRYINYTNETIVAIADSPIAGLKSATFVSGKTYRLENQAYNGQGYINPVYPTITLDGLNFANSRTSLVSFSIPLTMATGQPNGITSVTITATALKYPVTLGAGDIVVLGSYNNIWNIVSRSMGVSYSAGTGIAITNGVISSTAVAPPSVTGVFRGPWVANTSYGAYDGVINPFGVRVYALTAFTSTSTYVDANWALNVPLATATVAGSVRQGANTTIDQFGNISVASPPDLSAYEKRTGYYGLTPQFYLVGGTGTPTSFSSGIVPAKLLYVPGDRVRFQSGLNVFYGSIVAYNSADGSASISFETNTNNTLGAYTVSLATGGVPIKLYGTTGQATDGAMTQAATTATLVFKRGTGIESGVPTYEGGNTASGNRSLVLSGSGNTASGSGAVVVGGLGNSAEAEATTVSGGSNNHATMAGATIAGGYNNTVNFYSGFIGSGNTNTVSGYRGAVVGGLNNKAMRNYAFVGGGEGNEALLDYSAIAGGLNNKTSGQHSFIGGGQGNSTGPGSDRAVITGGEYNTVNGALCSVHGGTGNVVAGLDNHIYGSKSCSIGAGAARTVLINCQGLAVDNRSDETYLNNVLLRSDVAATFAIIRASLSNRNAAPCRLVYTGSSTTAGNNTSEAYRYVNLLTARLQVLYPNATNGTESPTVMGTTAPAGTGIVGVQGYNCGINGTTSADYLNSTSIAAIAALKPRAVFHMIGSNDFANGVPPATYKANVLANIAAINAQSNTLTLQVLINPYQRFDIGATAYPFAAYAAAMAEIASANPATVAYIDLNAAYVKIGIPGTDPLDIIQDDNQHQRDGGHDFMARLLMRALGLDSAAGAGTASAAGSGTTYTAGSGIAISGTNVISSKLYDTTGQAIDGAMTQAAVTAALTSVPLTYAQLTTALAGAGTLRVGQWYTISDYQTTHTVPGTTDTNTGPVEPLLLLATAPNKLAPNGYSLLYLGDIVYYTLDNTDPRLPGATKGSVYRRIDTLRGNDIEADFRVVKFRRWETTAGSGVFTVLTSNGGAFQDGNLFHPTAYAAGQVIGNRWSGFDATKSVLGNISTVMDAASTISQNTLTGNSTIYNNTLINGVINQNTLTTGNINQNTLNNGSIGRNVLTTGSGIISNTLTNGSYIAGSVLSASSTISSNVLTNTYINNNTLTQGSVISSLAANGIQIYNNVLSNGTNLSNVTGTFTGNTLTNTQNASSASTRGFYLNNRRIDEAFFASSYVSGTNIVVDFSSIVVITLPAAGNVAYGPSLNVVALGTAEHYITNTTTAAITLSFPGWDFSPLNVPTTLGAGKTLTLKLRSLGTTDATVKAFYVQASTGSGSGSSVVVEQNLTSNSTTSVPSIAATYSALAPLAPLNSPVFTGTPSLPQGTQGATQIKGTSTTQLATTAFVGTSLGDYAPQSVVDYYRKQILQNDGSNGTGLAVLKLGDIGTILRFNDTTKLTIPYSKDANGAGFDGTGIGNFVDIMQEGYGIVSVVGAPGVTLDCTEGAAPRTYGHVTIIRLIKLGTDYWQIISASQGRTFEFKYLPGQGTVNDTITISPQQAGRYGYPYFSPNASIASFYVNGVYATTDFAVAADDILRCVITPKDTTKGASVRMMDNNTVPTP